MLLRRYLSIDMENTKKLSQAGENGKVLSIESDFFFSLHKSTKMTFLVAISCVIISILMLIASILVVTVGKGKDKIIERDASGRPALLKVDSPSEIHAPELDIFVKDAVPAVLAWTYMEIRDQEDFTRRMQKVSSKFTPKGFQEFFDPFKDIYLRSIVEQRLIVRAEFDSVKDAKIKGPEAFLQIAVKRSSIRVIGEGASEEQKEGKLFEIRVHKGERTLANPYGLYISRFSELITSK